MRGETPTYELKETPELRANSGDEDDVMSENEQESEAAQDMVDNEDNKARHKTGGKVSPIQIPSPVKSNKKLKGRGLGKGKGKGLGKLVKSKANSKPDTDQSATALPTDFRLMEEESADSV